MAPGVDIRRYPWEFVTHHNSVTSQCASRETRRVAVEDPIMGGIGISGIYSGGSAKCWKKDANTALASANEHAIQLTANNEKDPSVPCGQACLLISSSAIRQNVAFTSFSFVTILCHATAPGAHVRIDICQYLEQSRR